MSLPASLQTLFLATEALTSLVEGGAGMRIYPGMAPPGAPAPCIVWHSIASTPDTTLAEAAGSGVHTLQFSCLTTAEGGGYLAAHDLGVVLMAALDNATLAGGERVLSVFAHDGFSEAVDQFIRLVEARIFVPAAA
jgi:hypothetical protein